MSTAVDVLLDRGAGSVPLLANGATLWAVPSAMLVAQAALLFDYGGEVVSSAIALLHCCTHCMASCI